MDSSNPGTPSVYSGSGGSGSEGAGEGGVPPNEDECNQTIEARLEDIEQYEFYKSGDGVPRVGTVVHIKKQKRIVAVDEKGRAIGSLPTDLHYLATCLGSGFKYEGKVVDSEKSAGKPAVVTIIAEPKQ